MSADRAGGTTVRLPNGAEVVIRPVQADDRAISAAFVAQLSPEARYFRFKRKFERANEPLIDFLTRSSADRDLALVAIARRDGLEEEIAEARIACYPDGKTCEFAIAIVDAWQGTGLAGQLMRALEDAARARGLATIEGFVMSANHRMLHFMRARGFECVTEPSDPHVTRVTKRLAGQPSTP